MLEKPRAWEIARSGAVVELQVEDRSSLDAITIQLPGGYYTTFRTYAQGCRVVGLSTHLARLYGPAGQLRLQPACTPSELRRALDGLLEPYRPGEARVRLSLDGAAGRVFVFLEPLRAPPAEVYARGIHAVTTQARRETPLLKKTAFIADSQADRAALRSLQAYEGLIVRNGRILEGLTSNFFYLQDGALGTAGRGVLHGVTRGELLRLARQDLALPLRFRALRVGQLEDIQEAFICSSSRGIVPVVAVDRVRIGDGLVGEWTTRLSQAYQRSVAARAEAIHPAPR